ncbi:unnamed protein product [marine sediment metagenome]|uniref:Uncharacterized protein n=1 Tax=marine sediment metagenome TaxID=412755 RepID=X1B480_9ZZZZ
MIDDAGNDLPQGKLGSSGGTQGFNEIELFGEAEQQPHRTYG